MEPQLPGDPQLDLLRGVECCPERRLLHLPACARAIRAPVSARLAGPRRDFREQASRPTARPRGRPDARRAARWRPTDTPTRPDMPAGARTRPLSQKTRLVAAARRNDRTHAERARPRRAPLGPRPAPRAGSRASARTHCAPTHAGPPPTTVGPREGASKPAPPKTPCGVAAGAPLTAIFGRGLPRGPGPRPARGRARRCRPATLEGPKGRPGLAFDFGHLIS